MNTALLLKLYFHIREFSFFSANIFFSFFFFLNHTVVCSSHLKFQRDEEGS